MKKFLSILSLIIIAFASCKKTDSPVDANIRFVNLSPNSSSLDLNSNNALLVGSLTYGTASSYRAISSSTPLATVLTTGSTTPLLSGNLQLTASKYFSFFVFDSTTTLKVSLVEDDRTPPAATKCNIRFLNFYKGSVSVDIKRGGTINLFTARSLNDHSTTASYSQYSAIDAGPFSLTVFIAGTSVALFQLPSIDFVAGKNYTLVLRGFSSTTSGSQAMVLTSITDN